MMHIGIAADHGGFELKVKLTMALKASGYKVEDFGAYELVNGDDYPEFVVPMAIEVSTGEISHGLAICGSGIGACIAANKVHGVRAALIADSFSAQQGVEADGMNVMCLDGNFADYSQAWELILTFLNARSKEDERLIRRLEKLKTLEINPEDNSL